MRKLLKGRAIGERDCRSGISPLAPPMPGESGKRETAGLPISSACAHSCPSRVSPCGLIPPVSMLNWPEGFVEGRPRQLRDRSAHQSTKPWPPPSSTQRRPDSQVYPFPVPMPGVMRESVADSHPNPTPPPRQGRSEGRVNVEAGRTRGGRRGRSVRRSGCNDGHRWPSGSPPELLRSLTRPGGRGCGRRVRAVGRPATARAVPVPGRFRSRPTRRWPRVRVWAGGSLRS